MSRQALVLLLCGFVVAGCERIPGTKEHAIRKGSEAAAALLHDPSSAQFRKTSLRNVPAGFYDIPTIKRVVCGEINGKNLQGAYAGFTAFLADPDDPNNAELQPHIRTEVADFQKAEAKCLSRVRGSYSDRYEQLAACDLVIDQAMEQTYYAGFVENYVALCVAEPGDTEAAEKIASERIKARGADAAAADAMSAAAAAVAAAR